MTMQKTKATSGGRKAFLSGNIRDTCKTSRKTNFSGFLLRDKQGPRNICNKTRNWGLHLVASVTQTGANTASVTSRL